jgi:ABC-type amino acid transport substrate-binding protein
VVCVRADDTRVHAPDDLGKQQLKVGHVDDPAVKRSLYALGGGRFEVRTTVVELFRDLLASRLDAVVYDSLYVRWRAARQHDIRVVGEPLNRLGYHVGLRRADATLVHDVEAAIRGLGESGELDAIRGRWEGGQ